MGDEVRWVRTPRECHSRKVLFCALTSVVGRSQTQACLLLLKRVLLKELCRTVGAVVGKS